jgi:hypothetical protein
MPGLALAAVLPPTPLVALVKGPCATVIEDIDNRGGCALHLAVVWDNNNPGGKGLFDIAFGSAGNEFIVVENMSYNFNSYRQLSGTITLPFAIPTGVRIAMRQQLAGVPAANSRIRVHASVLNNDVLRPRGYAQCVPVGTVAVDHTSTISVEGGVWSALGPRLEVVQAASFNVHAISVGLLRTLPITAYAAPQVRFTSDSNSLHLVAPVVTLGSFTDACGPCLPALVPCVIPTGAPLWVSVISGVGGGAITWHLGIHLFG